MLRGLLFGGVWGLLVSSAGAVALSVLTGPVGTPPQAPKDTVMVPQEPTTSNPTPVDKPDETLAPSLGDAPAIDVQEPDPVSGALSDTSSVAKPNTGDVNIAMQAPDAASPSANVQTTSTDEGILPNPQSMAPNAPQAEATPAIDTAPATPVVEAPVVVETSPSSGVQVDLPDDPTVETQPVGTPPLDIVTEEPVTPEASVETEAAPEVVPEAVVEQQEPTLPEEPTETAEPRFALSAEGAGLTNRAPNVKTNRLPSISSGDAPAEEAETPAESVAGVALQDNAEAFENPENKPLMSIILIDDGSTGIGADALKSFPYPLTFALDASKPDATAKAETYRQAGFEVIMLTNLPRGATPSDVEVALESYKSTIPQAVAMLDLGDNGFASSPPLVAQAVQNLKSSGHGLLTLAGGLNSAGRVADRASLPNKPIFRDLDSNGQDATVIRRFLDNAAFKAGQTNGVALLGRLRPDTVSALVLWGGLQRAQRVALAPISAVLLKTQ